MPTRHPNVTVCICTYNRAGLLQRALGAMADMQIPAGVDWELLVIDNNSSDGTKDVAAGFRDRLPLKYVFEEKQGLSNARNRAMDACRCDLLVFTDDDVRGDRHWLAAYVQATNAFPSTGYFGGRVLLDWPNGRPRWVKDENISLLSGLFVKYDLGTEVREYLPIDPLPFGASFAITRKLFEAVGAFRPDLGVSGENIGRGEEADYLIRARGKGFEGVYIGNAVCRHRVDPTRLSLGYMFRYGTEKGIAEARIHGSSQGHGSALLSMARYALSGLFQLAKGREDRFRQCVINMGIECGLRMVRDKS